MIIADTDNHVIRKFLVKENRVIRIAGSGKSGSSIAGPLSALEMNQTVTLSAVTPPNGVTLLDDLEETVIATITPPTQEPVEDEIETETELVGEDGEPIAAAVESDEAQRQAEGDTADEAAQASGDES